jgi:hypothetical protein
VDIVSQDAYFFSPNMWLDLPVVSLENKDEWPPPACFGLYNVKFSITRLILQAVKPWFEFWFKSYSRWRNLLQAVAWMTRLKEYLKLMSDHAWKVNVVLSTSQRRRITRGMAQASQVFGNCCKCRLNAATSYQTMSLLPFEQATMIYWHYRYFGSDDFGYSKVRLGFSNRKCRAYFFTSMQYLAVHTDVLNALTTDFLVNALAKPVNQRGYLAVILRVTCSKPVRTERGLFGKWRSLEQHEIGSLLQLTNIDGKYNPTSASRCGGWWERNTRSIGRLLLCLRMYACWMAAMRSLSC